MSLSKLVLPLLVISMFVVATCDVEQDKKKCENTLLGMATCLPYVGGQSTAPPMDCCTGFNKVMQDSPDCICLLIKDRNDPSLGLQINSTLALGLPARCKSHANRTIQDCPAILHLPQNSPDAKVFEDFANSGNKSHAAALASSSGNSSARPMAGTTTSANQNSSGGRRKTWLQNTTVNSIMLLALPALLFFHI